MDITLGEELQNATAPVNNQCDTQLTANIPQYTVVACDLDGDGILDAPYACDSNGDGVNDVCQGHTNSYNDLTSNCTNVIQD